MIHPGKILQETSFSLKENTKPTFPPNILVKAVDFNFFFHENFDPRSVPEPELDQATLNQSTFSGSASVRFSHGHIFSELFSIILLARTY